MRKESGDTIRFESRAELGLLLNILDEYKENHKSETKKLDEVKELYNILDMMEFNW